jgi:hypothetical protein
MVGDIGSTEMKIEAILSAMGVGHHAELAVAEERAFVPVIGELFPNKIVATENELKEEKSLVSDLLPK